MSEYIKHAANLYSDGQMFIGKSHAECFSKTSRQDNCIQGFLTSEDKFVNRREAGVIAWKAKQIRHNPKGRVIISEDIWFYGYSGYDSVKGYYFLRGKVYKNES